MEQHMSRIWKKGRGKLGFLQPLLGRWSAVADSEMGPVRCTRLFESVLGGAWVRLEARWEFGPLGAKGSVPRRVYEESALIGPGEDGQVGFWSFTSDGKRSAGTVADVKAVHPEAIGFTAQMPAGLARMVYWPDEEGGFFWIVESKTVKGWRRFVEHHYTRHD
jgi:hypothetical protein